MKRLQHDPPQVKTLNFLGRQSLWWWYALRFPTACFVDAQLCICLSVALGSGPCALGGTQLLMSQVRLGSSQLSTVVLSGRKHCSHPTQDSPVENPDGSGVMFVASTALGCRRGAGVLARQMVKGKVFPQETQERFAVFFSLCLCPCPCVFLCL